MAEAKIYLSLSGDRLDFAGIEKALHIKPSEIRQKGERLTNGKEFGHSEWVYESDIIETNDISELTAQFDFFEKKTEEMRKVAEENKAKWSILFYVRGYEDDFPTLYLPSSFIEFAGKIGADIGFDQYFLCAYT